MKKVLGSITEKIKLKNVIFSKQIVVSYSSSKKSFFLVLLA